MDYQDIAKKIVLDYANEHIDKTDNVQITLDIVFIVWFCKTLQNWKALVSTTLPDGMYYEITYNGDKKEVYIDAYKKFDNRCIKESLNVTESIYGSRKQSGMPFGRLLGSQSRGGRDIGCRSIPLTAYVLVCGTHCHRPRDKMDRTGTQQHQD